MRYSAASMHAMRISVRSRSSGSGKEPCSFCLGESRLRVMAIVERRDLADVDYFEVRVLDGRNFVLARERQTDAWELAAVYPRAARRPRMHEAHPSSRTQVRAPDRAPGKLFARYGRALAAFARAWKSGATPSAPAAPA